MAGLKPRSPTLQNLCHTQKNRNVEFVAAQNLLASSYLKLLSYSLRRQLSIVGDAHTFLRRMARKKLVPGQISE
jgi:hypothetical protein